MQHCGHSVVVDGVLVEIMDTLYCAEASHAHHSLWPHLMVLFTLVYGMSGQDQRRSIL